MRPPSPMTTRYLLRYAWITVTSLALIVAGMGLAAHAQRQPVLALAYDIQWNQHLSPDDLTTVDVVADHVEAIPADEADAVIGRALGQRLSAGTILTPALLRSPQPPLSICAAISPPQRPNTKLPSDPVLVEPLLASQTAEHAVLRAPATR